MGLLALLEDFVGTFDVPAKPESDPILCRDGWRCGAPGCSSRRNLHVHHVCYKSHGGGEGADNKQTLCVWHHLRGEHEGLACVRGKAPLALRWVLGRGGIGGRFINERRV